MSNEDLMARYQYVRHATQKLAGRFSDEQQLVQSMPDASPVKWHLAHTTWFFERLVLSSAVPRYTPVETRFDFLFNSYYESVGVRHPRPRRGLITSPTLEEVRGYRRMVDARMHDALPSLTSELRSIVRLGCEHEQQHQELILTDAKHALCYHMEPVVEATPTLSCDALRSRATTDYFVPHAGGLFEVGTSDEAFAFDNERPRHKVYVEPFEIATRCVTNAQWMEFMNDGGYRNPLLWLSDGWAVARAEQWCAPLYWVQAGEGYLQHTLEGLSDIVPEDPVCHVSFYEADAYARWRAQAQPGLRLPTEFEWELTAAPQAVAGNFLEQGLLKPQPARSNSQKVVQQLFGDVWEWTSSPYQAYPRFSPLAGALGEYNGKFMCNQFVLRGGSCFSPQQHLRPTYRNFFPPHARWQMTGVRLARYR